MQITARWSATGAGAAVPAGAAYRAVAACAAWLALPGLEEAAAAALAEAEGIVCHLTSLVLVDKAGEVRQGIPAQRKVPLMTPRTTRLVHMVPPDAMAFPPTSPTANGALFRRVDARAGMARRMFDIPTTTTPRSAAAAAVALLARAEAGSDRGAARLARAVLGSADAALLAAAARAVGL